MAASSSSDMGCLVASTVGAMFFTFYDFTINRIAIRGPDDENGGAVGDGGDWGSVVGGDESGGDDGGTWQQG